MYVKNCDEYEFLDRYEVLKRNLRILNAGSAGVRYGDNCLNVDIQPKAGVDVVCDLHELPPSLGLFDVIICNATLQYCRDPIAVADRFHDLLHDEGYVFVDAPWVQAYCPDTPDRFRFSEDGLRAVFSKFEILEVGPTIRPGSALLQLATSLARNLTPNKYVNFALGKLATGVLYPLRGLRTHREAYSAGAFYLIAQKRAPRASGRAPSR